MTNLGQVGLTLLQPLFRLRSAGTIVANHRYECAFTEELG